MSTSKKLRFLVKREDTGKVARIELRKENQVFDLLELSRSLLKFDEDAILSAHREKDDKEISEAQDLGEIADIRILRIRDKRTVENEKTKRKETSTMSSKRYRQNDKELSAHEKLLNKLRMQAVTNRGKSNTRQEFHSAAYIVLLGDVGSGKSTVVEKLTGEKGRSSGSFESCSRTSEAFWVPDASLIVSDTPGSNPMQEELEHNVWIAAAFNFRPVSRVFVVVKAETRIDNVVRSIGEYANRFLEPEELDLVGVLVTHMDQVKWTGEELKPWIVKRFGIHTAVFSGMDTRGEILLKNILETCTNTHNLSVDDKNFFKFFKLHDDHRKILQSTNDEIKKFIAMKKHFDEARKGFSGKDLVDLVFEFQAYMADEIVNAQKRLSEANNFTFMGDGAANEAGHVANMVNQLRMVLYDIRVECVGFQSEHGVSELRKCPYCGLIWTKVEGCDGDTTCGKRPDAVYDVRNSAYSVLATFAFQWVGDKLNIIKSGNKNVKSEKSSTSRFAGCGKTINWSKMATVAVPSEFSEIVKISTNDVKMLPPEASGFQKELSDILQSSNKAMKLANKPSRR